VARAAAAAAAVEVAAAAVEQAQLAVALVPVLAQVPVAYTQRPSDPGWRTARRPTGNVA
jgi:hypothetical protein